MPLRHNVEDTVASLVLKIPSDRVDDALKLLAVLHPQERFHRTAIVYLSLLIGAALLLGASLMAATQDPPDAILLAPMILGSVFVGGALTAAVGRPASLTQLKRAAEDLAASKPEPSEAADDAISTQRVAVRVSADHSRS